MEQPKAPYSAKKASGNPPRRRRGDIRNKILRDCFMSLISLGRLNWANRAKDGSGTTTPTSNDAYNSEGTSDG